MVKQVCKLVSQYLAKLHKNNQAAHQSEGQLMYLNLYCR